MNVNHTSGVSNATSDGMAFRCWGVYLRKIVLRRKIATIATIFGHTGPDFFLLLLGNLGRDQGTTHKHKASSSCSHTTDPQRVRMAAYVAAHCPYTYRPAERGMHPFGCGRSSAVNLDLRVGWACTLGPGRETTLQEEEQSFPQASFKAYMCM